MEKILEQKNDTIAAQIFIDDKKMNCRENKAIVTR
jgi:hypothetical protein